MKVMMSAVSSKPMAVHAAALVAILAMLPQALAHGWLQEPMSRNWLVADMRLPNNTFPNGTPQYFYNPSSLNKVGKLLNGATCGATEMHDTSFELGGRYATRTIAAAYAAGQVIDTMVQIYSNHWGYFEFRLCPLRSPSSAGELAAFSEACLAQHQLRAVATDTGVAAGNKVWLVDGAPGTQYVVKSSWRLPAGVVCPRCVLQWRYVTGHMCYLPGVDEQKMLAVQPQGIKPCPANHLDPFVLPSEKFWNCADVKIKWRL